MLHTQFELFLGSSVEQKYWVEAPWLVVGAAVNTRQADPFVRASVKDPEHSVPVDFSPLVLDLLLRRALSR